jgi:GlpG protein
MRLIGYLENETSARTFGDFLYVQGIENQIEFSKGDGWAIWINEEEQIENASKLLVGFREKPNDPKYQTEATRAGDLRAEKEKSEEAWRKQLRNRRHLFRPLTGYGFGPLTFVFIVISVVVFLRYRLGHSLEPIQSLFITPFMIGDSYIKPDLSLPEIRHGQIWRLFTPMFVHFNELHIFFNMLWLRDLGSMIEGRQSSWHLAIISLAVSAGSNLAQFYVSHFPNFGGMSGVVYGLLGYVWIRGKFDPASGLYLHRSTVIMMLIWLVACFTGLLGAIANYAHLAGLLMGMTWGWLSSLRYR